LSQRITTPAQQKWLLKLIGYDYSIYYRTGKNNNVPDALSRKGELYVLTGLSQPVHDYIAEIQAECLRDVEASNIIQQLSLCSATKPHYTLNDSQLLYKQKVFVPASGDWRVKILTEFHGGLIGGHAGVSRTSKRVSRSFAWPGLLKDVKKFVAECHICQQNHYETIHPPGLLQPNSIPVNAWKDVSMDFIDGLPSSGGKTVILVVVDRLTRYAHFIPLSHPYTAQSVAQAFVNGVFRLHGMPASIISDRDPIFLSNFWEAFFALQGTKLHKSSAYHPQSDGLTENLNRTLEQYLR
jgi:hypothetical protein